MSVLSGWEQLVRGATNIAGNQLDVAMTDAPDIFDVSIGSPLETSNHCFVRCELLMELIAPEYNGGPVVHLN